MDDCYHPLGIENDATSEQIEQAYKEKVEEVEALIIQEKKEPSSPYQPQLDDAFRRLERIQQAYSTLSNAKTRKQHDAYLQKLQDNQYEKFMPSWHRWYFEDRNRSMKFRLQREDSSSSSSEEEDGKTKEKEENMDEEAQQEENAANDENNDEAKATTSSSSREGGRKRTKRVKKCTCCDNY